MASWPSTLPAPQKSISITPGDTRKERKLQSGRIEFRRLGDGKPDQTRVPFRLTWAQWDIFKEFHAHELNLGINWFSADWLVDLGYDAHKARILGYPREVARQSYYVDVLCNLIIQKTTWIVGEDTEWPCESTGVPPEICGYIYVGKDSTITLQDCDQYIPDTWTSQADAPLPARWLLAASTVSGRGYIYGGALLNANSVLYDCDEYVPDSWTSKTNMPAPNRRSLAASTIGSSGYVYGGHKYKVGDFSDCDQYTPDVWVSKTNIPAPARYDLAAFTISEVGGHIVGGFGYIPNVHMQDCDRYVPDTWTSKTNMPSPGRRYFAASTIGNSGYIYGGRGAVSIYFQDCDEYTPDSWVSKTNMPASARGALAASTIESSGYVYGGYSGACEDDCDEYTPDVWVSKSNMPAPARSYLAASTI